MKKCTKCLEWKEESEFFKDKQKLSGYRPDCKKCNIKRSVLYNRKHKDRNKIRQIKWSTGLSESDYKSLLIECNNKCCICGNSELTNKRLSIDHCHETQLVRGLLCNSCNIALGLFKESKEILLKAVLYLDNNYSSKGILHKEKKHKIKRNE